MVCMGLTCLSPPTSRPWQIAPRLLAKLVDGRSFSMSPSCESPLFETSYGSQPTERRAGKPRSGDIEAEGGFCR